jgi:hypothetical protein
MRYYMHNYPKKVGFIAQSVLMLGFCVLAVILLKSHFMFLEGSISAYSLRHENSVICRLCTEEKALMRLSGVTILGLI